MEAPVKLAEEEGVTLAVETGNNAMIAALSLVFIAPAILILLVTSRFLSGKSSAVGGFGRL